MTLKHLAFLLFMVLAAAPRAAAAEPEVVRFGVCFSLSGEFADHGLITLAGVKMFVDDFNSRSDEHGLAMEMILRDDKSDPDEAVRIFTELAETEKVAAVIGGSVTATIYKVAELAKKLQVVLITPDASNPALGFKKDWTVKILPDDDQQGKGMADYLVDKRNLRRAAVVVNENNPYGISLDNAFSKAYEAAGGVIVGRETYDWDHDETNIPDFTGILMMIKAMKPDVVFLPSYAEEASNVVYQSLMVDFSPVFCGGDAWIHQRIIESSGNNIEGAYFTGGADLHRGDAEAKRFLDLYDVSNDPYAEESSVNGYDAAFLLSKAFMTGARTGKEVLDALYGLGTVSLAAGKLKLDPENGGKKTMLIHRIIRDDDVFRTQIVAAVDP